MILKQEGGEIVVERPSDESTHKALHGLTRTLVANMVEGVTQGLHRRRSRSRELVTRPSCKPYGVLLSLGFSHQIEYKTPAGMKITTPNPTTVVVAGIEQGTGRAGGRGDPQLPQARALQGQGREVSGRSGSA